MSLPLTAPSSVRRSKKRCAQYVETHGWLDIFNVFKRTARLWDRAFRYELIRSEMLVREAEAAA